MRKRGAREEPMGGGVGGKVVKSEFFDCLPRGGVKREVAGLDRSDRLRRPVRPVGP